MRSDAKMTICALGRTLLVAAWYLALAIIALVATGVELDRQGRFTPWLAARVPEPFQADSLVAVTKLALERKDSLQAEALAQKLVMRRPIPAEALSLYAEGLLTNGKEEAGAAALQTAAGRGWRDRFVQRVVILSALQQGAPEIAAQRVAALWRLGERADWLKDLTRTTLQAPGGLSAFETTLIAHDRYLGTEFLVWAVPNLPLGTVDRLAERMAANRNEFDCVNFSDRADHFVSDGKGEAAIAVWNTLCSPANRRSINDLAFQTEDVLPGPFDWRYPENPGMDTEVRHERGDVVLHYSTSDPLLRVIARRYVALGSGYHVLKINRSGVNSGVKLRVACVAGIQPPTEINMEGGAEGQWSFVVPSDCPTQVLRFEARSGAGDIGRIEMLQHRD